MSANCAIASKRSSISRSVNPRIAALRRTFSRPENSGLKPAPSSSSAATRPCTVTRPTVGVRVPAISCSSVLLPAPLRPTMPTFSPAPMSNVTSRSAQNSR